MVIITKQLQKSGDDIIAQQINSVPVNQRHLVATQINQMKADIQK